MSVLTIELPAGDAWTWDDLQAIPDEGHHHYQLIEGQIVMSPRPNLHHQDVVLNLAMLLRSGAPRELKVVIAPFDFVPEPATSLQPDVLVLRRGSAETNRTVVPPVLVVEVLSKRTRTFDVTAKRALYERFGVTHYWIVDPDAPSILALELDEVGSYSEAASVSGDDTFVASGPFPIAFTPSALVAD